jgi:magnesium-transporting ATPase (P-type)
MITGDNQATANAISQNIGIFDDPEGNSLTGEQFEKLNEHD